MNIGYKNSKIDKTVNKELIYRHMNNDIVSSDMLQEEADIAVEHFVKSVDKDIGSIDKHITVALKLGYKEHEILGILNSLYRC